MSGQQPRGTLESRVVVVTDADHERGAELARSMATLRATVVVAGVDADALGALAAEIGAAGARVAVLVDDVGTAAGRAALVEMMNELFPRSS